MRTTLQSIRIYIVLTLLTGIVYPLAMTDLRVNVLQLSRLIGRLHRRRLLLTPMSPVAILALYRRRANATSRYWQYRLHASVREFGDADDAGAGILLWRTRRTKECARDHDAELRLDGLDHCVVVGLRIFALFLRRSEERHRLFRNHRQPQLGGPSRHHARPRHRRTTRSLCSSSAPTR